MDHVQRLRRRPPRLTTIALGAGLALAAAAADPVGSCLTVGPDGIRFGLVRVDAGARTVSFPAHVNMTNGILEYAVVTDYGKVHESLLFTEARPVDLQSALLLLNARPVGTNGLDLPPDRQPEASRVTLRVLWDAQGRRVDRALSDMIRLTDGPHGAVTGALAPGPWLFNGSMISAEGFAAHFEGSLVSLIRDPVAIVNNPQPSRDDDEIHAPAPDRVPPVGTAVTVEITVPKSESAPREP